MNKKLLHLTTLLLIAPAMSSCSLIDAILNNDSSSGGNSSTYVPVDPVIEEDGYYKPSTLAYKATDYDEAFSPSTGNLNVLIIPIEFNKTNSTVTYTESSYAAIEQRYFGDQNDSLKTYYKNASHGKLNVSGVIANKYVSNLSASTVNEYSDERFNAFLKTAYDWTLANNPSIDFSIFDSNNDGYIDSVHFMTNLSANAFGGYKGLDPDGFLWPHMWFVQDNHNKPGTHAKPALDVYLCTSFGMIGDTTSIHEQGHVFGVEDYYNYTDSSSADYIGGADMQDLNCFDWNSYSKMLMDWTQPYVVDGKADSVTITIKPASTSGDCILIPADGSKWNGSAYDEYILLELFTKSGNNALDWDNWTSIASMYGHKGATSLGNGGVRMYHVDSRLYGFNEATATENYYTVKNGGYITNPKTTTYKYVCLPQTNSYNNYDYSPYYVPAAKDYKQLTLIQAGKVNTFKSGTSRNALAKSDLFQTGNVFNMTSYASFFKNGKFNNGDTFPYTITFNSVTSESATITISK